MASVTATAAAEKVVDVLIQGGITHFFGLPGGSVMEIFRAMHPRQDRIKVVVPRDEQAASCMAETYGKLTGRPAAFGAQGLFAASTGMFGVLESFLVGTPMLILTELSEADTYSEHSPLQSGTGKYGSYDLEGVFRNNTKFHTVAHYPREAVLGVQLAIKHAVTGRPGPAACIFRSNALKGEFREDELPAVYDTKRLLNPAETCPPAREIERAAGLLLGAERPVIVAGNGLRQSKGFDELRETAEALGAPVVTSFLGKSSIAENHPLAAGTIGYTGTAFGNDTLARADVVLVVGCRLKPQETCFSNPKVLDPDRQRLIQIDIEPRNTSWTVPVEISLVGDAALTLRLLNESLGRRDRRFDPANRLKALQARKVQEGYFDHPSLRSEASPVLPQRVVAEIREALPDEAIVCTDAGSNRHWMSHFFQSRRVNSYFGTGGLGGVSYSLPAALAAKLVHPGAPVVGVCSDGGFAMQFHVLLTAVQYGLSPIYVVMNNSSLGMTAHELGAQRVGTDFNDVDFAAIARACGCFGERVDRPGQTEEAIRAALRDGRPAVVDVVISAEEDMKKAIFSPYAREALNQNKKARMY